ncbi:MAG: hypothetical protein QOE90_10 [Thermoplasmata archaeon]|jgi:hypothetical protein|nr:hypothetical protein [Thermoplasmata archaeon]
MTKLTIAILAALVAVPMLHIVAADESHADCEKNVTWYDADGTKHVSDQGWAGYTQTDSARTLFYQATAGTPLYFNNCEGEQWDGQDSVNPGFHSNSDPCSAGEQVDATHPAITQCMGTDPNQGTSSPVDNPGSVPVRTRVSGEGETTGTVQVYESTQIGGVGWAVVYLGSCTNQNGQTSGLEGDASCQGKGQNRQGVYLRDDTPPNALATAVSSAGLTKGYVSEGDCDQSTYQSGAEQGDRMKCGRDNTALGLEEDLLS